MVRVLAFAACGCTAGLDAGAGIADAVTFGTDPEGCSSLGGNAGLACDSDFAADADDGNEAIAICPTGWCVDGRLDGCDGDRSLAA